MAPAAKYTPQQQEQMVLDAAEKCIEASSLLDFSMSAIAKSAQLSMGSIYKHVQSKEDVLIALATTMFRNELALYEKVLQLPLTTPEKIIACSLMNPAKVQTYSFQSQLDNLVSSQALLNRASHTWLERMFAVCKTVEQHFYQCFLDAANSGEFQSGIDAIDEINIALWSMTVGYLRIVQQHLHWDENNHCPDQQNDPIVSPDNVYISAIKRLVNAYQWSQPLTNEGIEKVCQALEENGLR